MLRLGTAHKLMPIFTNNQVVIKAFDAARITSRLIWNWVFPSNELGEHSKVFLAWVPGYEDNNDDEKADAAKKTSRDHCEMIGG